MDIPVLPIKSIFSTFGGTVVYTTFEEGLFGTRLPINCKKVFYMWDLDWHCNGLDYSTNLEILQKSDTVYCRCENHQAAILNYFGVHAHILENFNMRKLYNGNECR